MAEPGSKRGELAQFEIKHVNLDELTDENCVGKGSYGAAFRVSIDGVPRIAKRIHNILLSSDISSSEKKAIQERFYNECVLLSELDHPNIVEFIGVHYYKTWCMVVWRSRPLQEEEGLVKCLY